MLIDQAIHTIDMVQWLVNSRVKSVHGHIDHRALQNIEVEDVADAIIEFENGVRYSLFACNYNSYNAPIEFEISGEYAGLHVLLTCRGERTEEQLEKAAETEGIRVYGLSGSYIGKKDTESRTVILGYASLTEEKIQEGAAALAKALCP